MEPQNNTIEFDHFQRLSNNIKIPILGFGVYNIIEEKILKDVIKCALNIGYRHFDTASIYNNEFFLGEALKESKISRNNLFITTKLWNTDYGYENTIKALEKSLNKLHFEYIDLFLIHWPQKEKLIETWEAMEQIYYSGRVKSIGVSNFSIEYLDILIKQCNIVPMVNQIEHHPYLMQNHLLKYCYEKEIQIVAHSPLMWGRISSDDTFRELSNKYKKSVAQIILRWNIQRGIVVIPKSVHISRILENADIFDFEINESDMDFISSFDKNYRIGGSPNKSYK